MTRSSTSPFVPRHIGTDATDQQSMLKAIGWDSLDELIDTCVPSDIRQQSALELPTGASEEQVTARLREFADANIVTTSLIGMGFHRSVTPPVIQRNVVENPAWYTAYTPYQPEISQGRLEVLLTFQTMVADLTGLPLANASLLDEPTAVAEGMALALRADRGRSGNTCVVDPKLHPHSIEVVRTRAWALDIDLRIEDPATADLDDAFAIIVAYPTTTGGVADHRQTVERAHEAGAMAVASTDLLAMTLLTSPGEMGFDVAVGSSQRFGLPLWYGGPHAGFIATRNDFQRQLPGRLVGVSVDAQERPALRLALQTREQHIRRERATSNICTAQSLPAMVSALYACYHGAEGLRAIAERTHGHAARFADILSDAGISLTDDHFFDTVTVKVSGGATGIVAAALEQGVNLRLIDDDHVSVAFDETSDDDTVDKVLEAFGSEGQLKNAAEASVRIPEPLQRTSGYLDNPVFSSHRSETAMMRYLRTLADKDLALDRTMIPLGSCTMKLNAATEMDPITWPEFTEIHPFAPREQAAGYLELIEELEQFLVEITGYDAASLQPNAGSQGEFAGLLAIRRYHEANGEGDRKVCLIPESAHGTNAASAVMAGLEVVVVACDEAGNIDVADLEAKADKAGSTLAGIMITYPSTHGVYEASVRRVCEIIHDHGGQVYLDGANLNALVGLAQPGKFGADVSHLNLHKTFCIPHGGGGPGVGPIVVKSQLAPYLPSRDLTPFEGTEDESEGNGERLAAGGVGAISGTPFGSAGILAISWAFIALMGPDGLTEATRSAVLNANYLATRLSEGYDILYTGERGTVAHECIVDIRPLTEATGVTAEDIAKRLIDFGFHAPTMSFPVAGTLMVEPTESEPLPELDRFCDAMLAIREEIAAVERGEHEAGDSPLRHAPHTALDLVGDDWKRPYSRQQGGYPTGVDTVHKYWVPVARVDNPYGDRNLMCSCPPVELT